MRKPIKAVTRKAKGSVHQEAKAKAKAASKKEAATEGRCWTTVGAADFLKAAGITDAKEATVMLKAFKPLKADLAQDLPKWPTAGSYLIVGIDLAQMEKLNVRKSDGTRVKELESAVTFLVAMRRAIKGASSSNKVKGRQTARKLTARKHSSATDDDVAAAAEVETVLQATAFMKQFEPMLFPKDGTALIKEANMDTIRKLAYTATGALKANLAKYVECLLAIKKSFNQMMYLDLATRMEDRGELELYMASLTDNAMQRYRIKVETAMTDSLAEYAAQQERGPPIPPCLANTPKPFTLSSINAAARAIADLVCSSKTIIMGAGSASSSSSSMASCYDGFVGGFRAMHACVTSFDKVSPGVQVVNASGAACARPEVYGGTTREDIRGMQRQPYYNREGEIVSRSDIDLACPTSQRLAIYVGKGPLALLVVRALEKAYYAKLHAVHEGCFGSLLGFQKLSNGGAGYFGAPEAIANRHWCVVLLMTAHGSDWGSKERGVLSYRPGDPRYKAQLQKVCEQTRARHAARK